MSWDLALDLESTDVIFGPSRDLLGQTSAELYRQRIFVRCKVPRGTFGDDETFGSRLHEIAGYTLDRQFREAPPLVREALEPMDDIEIMDVIVEVTDNNRLAVTVKFRPILSPDETDEIVDDGELPDFDAVVTI